MSIPALLTKPAKMNCGRPGVAAQLSLPGCCLASAISSSIEPTPSEGCAATARNESEADATGKRVGVVVELRVRDRVDGDGAADREHERVLVARADERHDGDDAVRAGAVLHDDGLAPALGQALGKQARGDVGRAARAE